MHTRVFIIINDVGLGLGVYTPRQGQYEYLFPYDAWHGKDERRKMKDERQKTKDQVEGSMMQVRSNAEHDSFSVAYVDTMNNAVDHLVTNFGQAHKGTNSPAKPIDYDRFPKSS